LKEVLRIKKAALKNDHLSIHTEKSERIVDLGCGRRKTPGSVGVDGYAWPDVDIVADLNQSPWPLDENAFDVVVANHIIEHVADVVTFMAEIHRIAADGARVRIVTPHFSSMYSWQDPTHLRHMSVGWYELFTDGYLGEQIGKFQLVSSDVKFGSSLRCVIGKLIYRFRGWKRWEKHDAFRRPARDITTVLRIVKPKESPTPRN
jgi:SAM-dependent methyltransferase